MPRESKQLDPEEGPLTIDRIVGANVRALRHRKDVDQDVMREDLRSFGVTWNRNTVSHIEWGKRSLRTAEIWALARYFDVPVWTFFWPTPDLVNDDVVLADGKEIAAYELVTQMLAAPDDDVDYNPKLRAFMLTADAAKLNGVTPAIKQLRDAISA